jgi:hypothetical protein
LSRRKRWKVSEIIERAPILGIEAGEEDGVA